MGGHGLDPAGIEQARTQYLVELLLDAVHSRPALAGMVPKPQGWGTPLQLFDGGAQPPLELVIVIGIEQVVLAVVLVVEHHLHRGQSLLQPLAIAGDRQSPFAARLAVVTPAAPGEKGFTQIAAILPVAAID